MTPRILDRKVVHAGYVKVERLRLRLVGGAVVDREVESHGDAVAVLPYDAARRCVLVARLLRAPVIAVTGALSSEEACAGMIARESAEVAARREAEEELGVALRDLEFIGRVWSSPGVSTERVSLFLAPYCAADRTSAGGGLAEEHEAITVVERPLASLAAEANAGSITDAKLLTLILALRVRRPALFTPIE